MEELIINLIQTGAYSAVFAALLVYVIRAAAKREKFYRTFISELCVSLKQIGEVGGKVDELLRFADSAVRKKKAAKAPDYAEAVTAYAERPL